MNEKPRDNELKGVVYPNDSTHPKAPCLTGHLTVNGKRWRLSIWPEAVSKTGKTYQSVKLEEPKEGGGNYHNSPKPTEPKSPWPSGHGPSVYVPSPRPEHNQHKADAYAPSMDRDENLPF
jgi:hypothetical protein